MLSFICRFLLCLVVCLAASVGPNDTLRQVAAMILRVHTAVLLTVTNTRFARCTFQKSSIQAVVVRTY